MAASSYRFNFYPGRTSERLAEICAGKASIASVVRGFVNGASSRLGRGAVSDSDYAAVMEMGREMAALARTRGKDGRPLAEADLPRDDDGRLLEYGEITERICGWAELVLRLANRLKKRLSGGVDVPAAVRKPAISGSGRSVKVSMSESERRVLSRLAEMAGISRNAVLRALIMGLPLPDDLAWRTSARISQVGALARHISLKRPMPEEAARRLYATGSAIGAAAAKMGSVQAARSDEIGGLA